MDIRGLGITDDSIDVILSLKQLESLGISGDCNCSPEGMRKLCNLKRLTTVVIDDHNPPTWSSDDIEKLEQEFQRNGIEFTAQ